MNVTLCVLMNHTIEKINKTYNTNTQSVLCRCEKKWKKHKSAMINIIYHENLRSLSNISLKSFDSISWMIDIS